MISEDSHNLAGSEKRFSGVGVSPGIALAHAFVRNNFFIEPDKYIIDDSTKDDEISRLEHSIEETKKQIELTQKSSS